MNIKSFVSVFECHPGVDEIFVVDDMPFLNAAHAQSHSVATDKPVKAIKRADAFKDAEAAKKPVPEKETSKKGKGGEQNPDQENGSKDPDADKSDAEPPAPAAKKGRGKK